MTLPLAIWTTGSPVPEAEKKRGDFFHLIKEGVGDGFVGEVLDIKSMSATAFPDPSTVSGIIVSGSPARLGDQEDWMLRTEHALREAHAAGTPILGVCFGHQLLGEALGGRVAPNPRGREIGTSRLQTASADPLFDGVRAEPLVVMTHLDSVVEAPSGSKLCQVTALEGNAGLRFSETTWGVQFHPEMDAEIIGYYLEARRGDIEAEGLDVDALVAARKDSSYGADLLARFGRFCQTRRFD